MKVSVEKEHDNCRQTMELDDNITEVEEDMGILRVYTNVGENPSHYASVEFTKDELEALFLKFSEVKDRLKSNADLEGPEEPEIGPQ
jgi:hypothetical protein